MTEEPIRIGVSACLLGHQVRYDGGHKRDPFLAETLGRYVEWARRGRHTLAARQGPKELMLRNHV